MSRESELAVSQRIGRHSNSIHGNCLLFSIQIRVGNLRIKYTGTGTIPVIAACRQGIAALIQFQLIADGSISGTQAYCIRVQQFSCCLAVR